MTSTAMGLNAMDPERGAEVTRQARESATVRIARRDRDRTGGHPPVTRGHYDVSAKPS